MKHTNRFSALSAFFFLFLICVVPPVSAAGKDPLAKYLVDTGKSFPAGKQFTTPLTWAPGQYVVTGTNVKGKLTGVSKTLLVRKENGGWVIETVEIDKKGIETVSQILMLGYEEALKSNNFSAFQMGWMKSKDEKGVIQKIEGEELAMFNMFAKSTYEKLLVNIGSFIDGGTVVVRAGSFASTNYQKASVKIMGMTVETETWYHGAVPVNGMVKSQTPDGKTVTELLSFGFDGKSVFE